MDARSFIDRLQRRGFVMLGAGAFSTVLGKPGYPRVIKVGRGQPEGWIDYIMWADKAGYAGSFAPKVFSLKIHFDYRYGPFQWGRELNNSWYVAVMERLDCTIAAVTCPGKRRIYRHMASALYGDLPCKTLEDMAPGATKFCADLRAAGFEYFDLHDGNFMLRGNQVVCTDPLSSPTRTGTTRWRSSAPHPHLIAVNAALAEVAQRALIAA